MGLALGVDYALLMVSRFREELGGGPAAVRAAAKTRRTAGRTTVFAGSTLFSGDGRLGADPARRPARLAGGDVMVVIILSVSVVDGRRAGRCWRCSAPTSTAGGSAARHRPAAAVMTFVDAALRRPVVATA